MNQIVWCLQQQLAKRPQPGNMAAIHHSDQPAFFAHSGMVSGLKHVWNMTKLHLIAVP